MKIRVVFSTGAPAVRGAPNDWAEGTPGLGNGATRDFYNRAALLPWNNFLGDWIDANADSQGNQPYATAVIVDENRTKWVEWDVTTLVQAWIAGTFQNHGFLLKSVAGGGTFYYFRSKEAAIAAERPQLVLTTTAGEVVLEPEADTYLEAITYMGQGDSELLRIVSGSNNALLRFDSASFPTSGSLIQARLRLVTYAQFGCCSMTVGVFRCFPGELPTSAPPQMGLAAKYSGDQGIADDPDVLFFADFESATWQSEWSNVDGIVDTVDSDPPRNLAPLQGRALRAKIPQGGNSAMNIKYKFQDKTGSEPEEMFFRYYLRLGNDWNQTVDGGKLPGFSGTYDVAGWAGRRSDGTNGWSARGSFSRTIPPDNPIPNRTPIGSYVYHADQPKDSGDNWSWHQQYAAFLQSNRWYSIEQYVKLNTLGQNDGIIRAWVNGQLAFEKTDIRFRDVPALKIEKLWMNVYYGGTDPSPYDQHVYVDNVVIATKYIGPSDLGAVDLVPPDAPQGLHVISPH